MIQQAEFMILDAAAATGAGKNVDVSDFDYVIVAVATATSANLTAKFVGAVTQVAPDFAVAQSDTNHYDFLNVYDMENISTNLPAMIRGDTGFAPAGTDDFRLFRIDVRGLKWLSAVVTAWSAGSVTMKSNCYRSDGL